MRIVMVGGGLSGLTLAERLSREHDIVLIEKNKSLGGLARSIHTKNSTFDIGPHFFTAHDKKVSDYYLSFFKSRPEELIKGIKKTRLYINGKFISWPPTAMELASLDIAGMAAAGLRIIQGLFVKRKYASLEDYFIKNYGRRLYKLIFKPLFSTYAKMNLKDIDPSFAEEALSVATKQKKVGIRDMVWTIAKGKKVEFFYPASGSGGLIDNIEEKLKTRKNIEIIKGAEVASIGKEKIIIKNKSKNKAIKYDKLIWTAPFTVLCKMLNIPCPKLKFNNLVLYNIEFMNNLRNDYHYAYVAQKARPFHRFMLLHNVSSSISKYRTITLEKTTLNTAEKSTMANTEKNQVEKELILLGIISSPEEIISIRKDVIPYVYPVLYKGFRKDLVDLKRKIIEKNSNIILMGRSGNYSYLNMDHVLEDSLKFNII